MRKHDLRSIILSTAVVIRKLWTVFQVLKIAGKECRVFRLTFVGELGYEIHIDRDSALHVYEALTTVGKQFGLTDAGYRAIDSLSCEKGKKNILDRTNIFLWIFFSWDIEANTSGFLESQS